MDQQRFDDLTRALAGTTTRRGVLRAIGGALAGAVGLGTRQAAAAETRRRQPRPRRCRIDAQCRGGICCGGVCVTSTTGCCPGEKPCGGGCIAEESRCPGVERECPDGSCVADGCCPGEKPCGGGCISADDCCPYSEKACADGSCVGLDQCCPGVEEPCAVGPSGCCNTFAGEVCTVHDGCCDTFTHTVCDGHCVDTTSDPSHCGGCGHSCVPGAICQGGSCACPDGTETCGGACVDTGCPAGKTFKADTCRCECDMGTVLGPETCEGTYCCSCYPHGEQNTCGWSREGLRVYACGCQGWKCCYDADGYAFSCPLDQACGDGVCVACA